MTITPMDPYHDEDALDNDMTSAFDRDEPALVRSLKHVGESLRNGGFCSSKREKKKNDQNSIDVDTAVNTVSTSDDFNETGVMNKKSVSFCDLVVEPLIIGDQVESEEESVEETDNPKKEVEEAIEAENKKTESLVCIEMKHITESIDCNKTKKESSGVFFSLSTLVFVTAVGKAFFQFDVCYMDEVINPIKSSIETIWPNVVDLRSTAENKSGINLQTLAISIIGTIIVLLNSLRMVLVSEKRLKALIEFTWGAFVCTIVIAGVYFTYGHLLLN